MKTIAKITLVLIASLALTNCSSDENNDSPEQELGTMEIKWDNIVGQKDMNLSPLQNLDYGYKTADDQEFNITKFGYYITNIILEGPDGAYYEDNVLISAEKTEGVYHIMEEESASTSITLGNIPAGKYNKMTFTIGIPEEGVQEGAAGGVLDPAAGAWFWNWNAGYIGFAVEGHASTSTQSYQEFDSGFIIPEKSFAVHIGGWRDIEPADGEPQKFVNNIKTLTLNFDSDATVASNREPSVHILANAMALFDESNIDFSTTFAVHAPGLGKPFADILDEVFTFSHVHE